MANAIIVDGNRYKVTENLGWQGEYYAKEVKTENGNKVAVRSPGSKTWRFWTVEDRLAPLGGREGLKTYVNYCLSKKQKCQTAKPPLNRERLLGKLDKLFLEGEEIGDSDK